MFGYRCFQNDIDPPGAPSGRQALKALAFPSVLKSLSALWLKAPVSTKWKMIVFDAVRVAKSTYGLAKDTRQQGLSEPVGLFSKSVTGPGTPGCCFAPDRPSIHSHHVRQLTPPLTDDFPSPRFAISSHAKYTGCGFRPSMGRGGSFLDVSAHFSHMGQKLRLCPFKPLEGTISRPPAPELESN